MTKRMDSKGLIDKMLEDTASAIDSIKNDIEKSIVDYTFVPGKDIIETDDTISPCGSCRNKKGKYRTQPHRNKTLGKGHVRRRAHWGGYGQ